MALTIRQKHFVSEYLIDFNATRAATRAGYAGQTNKYSYELLNNPEIAAAIETGLARLERDNLDLRDRIVRELMKIAFSNMQDFQDEKGRVDLTQVTRDQAAAIQEITVETTRNPDRPKVKVKLYDKDKAMDRLCKMHGFDVPKKVEITSRTVNVDATDPQDAARIYSEMVKGG